MERDEIILAVFPSRHGRSWTPTPSPNRARRDGQADLPAGPTCQRAIPRGPVAATPLTASLAATPEASAARHTRARGRSK